MTTSSEPFLKHPPFVFYFVLRSTSRVDLPFSHGVFPKRYLSGASTLPGYSLLLSHETLADLYVPSKGKELHGFSTSAQPDQCLQTMAQNLDSLPPDLLKTDSPGFTYLHQATPFQSHSFWSEGQEVYVYGIYNLACEVLVVTNLADYDKLAHLDTPMEFFLYRFRQGLTSCAFSLNTKRIIARWSRWANSANSSLKTPAERFCVLDQSLFPFVQPYQRDDLDVSKAGLYD